MKPTVLVADDDRAIRESLARALRVSGYEVAAASDGVEVLTVMGRTGADVVVLDVVMPGIDGLGACRALRARGDSTPILMLTARVGVRDRVAGLDAGADDYLVKPFDMDELLARLRALLRRGDATAQGEPRTLRVGDIRVDTEARRVWRGNTEVELTRTEFNLLELLARNADIVLDHSTIYRRIWDYDFGPESKNLAMYISYLRRKLGRDDVIHTVRGVGYTIRSAP